MCASSPNYCFKITVQIWRSMKTYEAGIMMISIWCVRKLKFREFWWFAQDPQPAWCRVRIWQLLSIFRAQHLLTWVLVCVYSKALLWINEGTLCDSFLNMTCNMREFDWIGFHIFLLKIRMILHSRLCHMNKIHQTFTRDVHGHASKKRLYSFSLCYLNSPKWNASLIRLRKFGCVQPWFYAWPLSC